VKRFSRLISVLFKFYFNCAVTVRQQRVFTGWPKHVSHYQESSLDCNESVAEATFS